MLVSIHMFYCLGRIFTPNKPLTFVPEKGLVGSPLFAFRDGFVFCELAPVSFVAGQSILIRLYDFPRTSEHGRLARLCLGGNPARSGVGFPLLS
jgi:hypothetical protein